MRNIPGIGHIDTSKLVVLVISLFFFGLAGQIYLTHVYGVDLPLRSLLMSDNRQGIQATYELGFTVPSVQTLGSIKLLICANDPIIGDPCTPPAGFDISAATLSGQTGETGFSIYPPGTNVNTVVLSRVPSITVAQPVTYSFTNVTNPSSVGAYYGRIQTYASTDASGPENDQGGLAFDINNPVQVSATVPPYLLFCSGVTITGLNCNTASGNYINFGNLTSNSVSSAQSQIEMATNAQNGYGVQVFGTTMTSGNNTINAMTTPDVSRPSTNQFGMNLAANLTPLVGQAPQGPGSASVAAGYDLPDWFQFNPGNTIASVPTTDSYKQFTISYIVNIPANQTVGVYAATLTYVCLANF